MAVINSFQTVDLFKRTFCSVILQICVTNIIQGQTDFSECLQSGFNTLGQTFY